jgi:hypothetical protein
MCYTVCMASSSLERVDHVRYLHILRERLSLISYNVWICTQCRMGPRMTTMLWRMQTTLLTGCTTETIIVVQLLPDFHWTLRIMNSYRPIMMPHHSKKRMGNRISRNGLALPVTMVAGDQLMMTRRWANTKRKPFTPNWKQFSRTASFI